MDELIVEHRERVVHVTLNRPDRKNALDVPSWQELACCLHEFEQDDAQRVMILSGAGGDFCAGGDLSRSNRSTRGPAEDETGDGSLDTVKTTVTAVCLGIHHASKPVIAAVDGIAAGAGANLAFGCDLVLASERAQFSEIFIRRGLPMDSGGTWLLPRLVGLQKAKQLAFFGDWVGAEEARSLGLVNEVVPAAELLDEAHAWAHRLASNAPTAIAATKRALNRSFETSFMEALDAEAEELVAAMGSPEAQEAIRAFFEKRSSRD